MDLKGIGISARAIMDFIQASAKMDELNYPETLSHTLVINSPTIFKVLWKVIRLFLDPNVLAKTTVVSGNPTKALLEFIE
jgi:hypothetical protein